MQMTLAAKVNRWDFKSKVRQKSGLVILQWAFSEQPIPDMLTVLA